MKLDFPGSDMEPIDLKLGGRLVEEVKLFKYLGVNPSSDLSDLTEVKCCIAIAKEKFFERKELFRADLRLKTKLKVLSVFIWSIIRYGSETWAITKTIRDRIKAFEMWCYWRILKVPYTAHVTNSAISKRVSLEHAT